MSRDSTKITAILGHPLTDSFCAALLDAYVTGARGAGAEVRLHKLAEKTFDPLLHHAYRKRQELEPDLLAVQEDITWAEHLLFAFPVWWGVPPALMKGFFDRVFLPGFAYRFPEDGGVFQEKLLVGRSARVLCTMDSPPWYYRFLVGAPGLKMMKNSILKFCGVAPVRITSFGSVKLSTAERRAKWLEKAKKLGEGRS